MEVSFSKQVMDPSLFKNRWKSMIIKSLPLQMFGKKCFHNSLTNVSHYMAWCMMLNDRNSCMPNYNNIFCKRVPIPRIAISISI